MADRDNAEINSLIVSDLLRERRADRRWKNIRFIFWFALFAYVIFAIFGFDKRTTSTLEGKKYISLVRLEGMIAPGRDSSAEELLPILREAFADRTSSGVIIDINSPGGTPVQASIIYDALIAYKKRYKKKLIIVGEDLLTSGAYYVAVAGDKIYVNPNTITGSIGVIMKGFGFVDLMKKIGVERRVYMAGNDKDRLDPFLPQSPDDLKKVQQVIEEVHQNFAQAVLSGRKGKLNAQANILFTGDFWSGSSAVKLGLVDGLGNLLDVMDKEFQTTQFKEYSTKSSLLRFLSGPVNSAFDSMFSLFG